jgi:hypothetical protein
MRDVFTVRYELDFCVYFRFIFAFKGLKKVEVGYAVLYFQQGVLPFMFVHCNSKPNVAKMIYCRRRLM